MDQLLPAVRAKKQWLAPASFAAKSITGSAPAAIVLTPTAPAASVPPILRAGDHGQVVVIKRQSIGARRRKKEDVASTVAVKLKQLAPLSVRLN